MPRTRHIRQVLDPTIAKQEITNITKLYQALGWVVHNTVAKENGTVVHRIIASKGKTASVLVELVEAINNLKRKKKSVLGERAPQPHPRFLLHPKQRQMEQTNEERLPQFEKLRKEDLRAYVERDETGIVPSLVAECALVLEEGAVQFTRMIERDKFLHTREYFKRIGLTWTTNFRMELRK